VIEIAVKVAVATGEPTVNRASVASQGPNPDTSISNNTGEATVITAALPFTGTRAGDYLLVGLALLIVGSGLVVRHRRRQDESGR